VALYTKMERFLDLFQTVNFSKEYIFIF